MQTPVPLPLVNTQQHEPHNCKVGLTRVLMLRLMPGASIQKHKISTNVRGTNYMHQLTCIPMTLMVAQPIRKATAASCLAHAHRRLIVPTSKTYAPGAAITNATMFPKQIMSAEEHSTPGHMHRRVAPLLRNTMHCTHKPGNPGHARHSKQAGQS